MQSGVSIKINNLIIIIIITTIIIIIIFEIIFLGRT
jgi:hypothetical protein